MKDMKKTSFVTVASLGLFLLCSCGAQTLVSSEASQASEEATFSEDVTKFDEQTSPFRSVFYGYRKPANFSYRFTEEDTFTLKNGYLGSFGVDDRTDFEGERLTSYVYKEDRRGAHAAFATVDAYETEVYRFNVAEIMQRQSADNPKVKELLEKWRGKNSSPYLEDAKATYTYNENTKDIQTYTYEGQHKYNALRYDEEAEQYFHPGNGPIFVLESDVSRYVNDDFASLFPADISGFLDQFVYNPATRAYEIKDVHMPYYPGQETPNVHAMSVRFAHNEIAEITYAQKGYTSSEDSTFEKRMKLEFFDINKTLVTYDEYIFWQTCDSNHSSSSYYECTKEGHRPYCYHCHKYVGELLPHDDHDPAGYCAACHTLTSWVDITPDWLPWGAVVKASSCPYQFIISDVNEDKAKEYQSFQGSWSGNLYCYLNTQTQDLLVNRWEETDLTYLDEDEPESEEKTLHLCTTSLYRNVNFTIEEAGPYGAFPEYIATHEPDETLQAYGFPYYLNWDNMLLFKQ